MPAMKLSSSDWKEVRKASEAGVDDRQLSQDYSISMGAIRIRKMREKWLTPRRLAEEIAVAKARKEAKAMSSEVATRVVTGVTNAPAEASISAKMLSSAELIGSQIMRVLERKAKLVADNPEIIDDPETVGDLGTIVNVSRKIAGLDKPVVEGANIALNFGAFWQAPVSGESAGVVREVEKAVVVDV